MTQAWWPVFSTASRNILNFAKGAAYIFPLASFNSPFRDVLVPTASNQVKNNSSVVSVTACVFVSVVYVCVWTDIHSDMLLYAHENKNLASLLQRSYYCRHPHMRGSSWLCASRCKDLDHSQPVQPMVPQRWHCILFLQRQECLELSKSLTFYIDPTQEEQGDHFSPWAMAGMIK